MSRVAEGGVQRPLMDAVAINSIHSVLSETESNPLYGTLVFDAATQISLAVHKAILSRKGIGQEFTPTSLAENPTVNCHGHTVVLSEGLELAGVPHVVAVANGHSFVVATDLRTFAQLIDAQSPRLNGDIKKAVPDTLFTTTADRIQKSGRAVVRFYSEQYIVRAINSSEPFDSLSQKHPWLTPRPNRLDQRVYEDIPVSSRFLLNMLLYPPDAGRTILSNYLRFQYFHDTGLADRAYTELMSMGSAFPEVSATSSELDPVRDIALQLAKQGRDTDVSAVIASVGRALIDNQPRSILSVLWRPDTLRKIGTETQKVAFIEEAIKAYEHITPQTNIVRSKTDKAHRIRHNMLQTH